MANCIVCNQDVTEYTISVTIRGHDYPRNEIDTLANICPNCGILRIMGPDNSHIQLLSSGFPEATEDDLAAIDLDGIFNEVTLPARNYGEQLKWIDPTDLEGSSEDTYYQEMFKDGIPTFGKYKRLIHFLKMNPQCFH